MHRRARHLNPASSGATMALDSRFVPNAVNGSAITTWPNRTGSNSPTQATSGKRPVFTASGICGLPLLTFAPASTHQFDFTAINVTASYTFLAIFGRASVGINSIPMGVNVSTLRGYPFWWYTDNVQYFQADTAQPSVGSANSNTGTFLFTTTKNDTTLVENRHSGVVVGTRSSPPASVGRVMDSIGSSNLGGTVTHNGTMGRVEWYPFLLSASLLKRVTHAAAFSFKFNCS